MKISIVTISLNQGMFLEQAITSVIEQNYPELEYIVVDAGSTDNSRMIIEKYHSYIDKVLLGPDAGPADGLNKGFALATGEIFGFLNADDYLLPGCVQIIADTFKKNRSLDVVSGHGIFVDAFGKIERGVYSHRVNRMNYAYGTTVLVQQSTYFRREIFERAGGFNCANHVNWDGELWADFILKNARFGRVHVYLSAFRIHKDSITGSQKFRIPLRDEMQRIRKKLGVNHFNPFFKKLLWGLNRITDPSLMLLQIRNGMDYGFISPIPEQD